MNGPTTNPRPPGTGHPGASYTVTVRVSAPADPALLATLAQRATSVGAVVVGMDLVEVATAGTTVDLTLQAADEDHVGAITALLDESGYRVRHVSDRTFLYHLGGKIEVTPRVAVRTRQDLALAYTPGVGRVASAIARRPADAWALTAKGSSVAIATDGSAVLGLGPLGPLAALPVMEGKALLFKHFGGVNAYPLCLDTHSTEELINTVAAIAPGFGGINLEDIASPGCFEVEAELQRRLDIPVFHDDQHGTAIVVMAAVLNACRLTGRDLKDLRAVLVGCGAAGTAVAEALLDAGTTDLVVFDRDGVLAERPGAPAHHARLAGPDEPGRCPGRGRPVYRDGPPWLGRPRATGPDGPAPDGLRPVQPRARSLRRGAAGRRRHRHRPQRFPQPDQQLLVLPRLLQRRPGRPLLLRDPGDENGSDARHRRFGQRRGAGSRRHRAVHVPAPGARAGGRGRGRSLVVRTPG